MRPLYDEAIDINLAKMSPGLIDAIDEASDGTIRAKHLDTRYNNKKAGAVLSILENAGDLTEVIQDSTRSSLYELAVESLEPARQDALEMYQRKIENSWMRVNPSPEYVLDDIDSLGVHISESADGEELTRFRDDYHQDTLQFLERLDIINNLDERKISADDPDIEYLEENLETHVENVLNSV